MTENKNTHNNIITAYIISITQNGKILYRLLEQDLQYMICSSEKVLFNKCTIECGYLKINLGRESVSFSCEYVNFCLRCEMDKLHTDRLKSTTLQENTEKIHDIIKVAKSLFKNKV